MIWGIVMTDDFEINALLIEAKKVGASDLHVTVGVPPKARINGTLVDLPFSRVMPDKSRALLFPMLNAHTSEQLQENGETDFSYSIQGVGRYRVNAFKQRGSYAIVARLVASEIPTVEQLGLPNSVVSIAHKKRGLVLVTGPTGSGKSTTLAAIINKINIERNTNIITLEDPIEYLHNHKKSIVNQREIGLDTKGFSAALRAALREDPDVILVGEMRDLDTISIAITAAETGHLVLSTLHTTGVAKTVDRILDVFPPQQQQQMRAQLANVLESVISQQLIPTTDGKRVAAFEVMHLTPAVANLIREAKTHQIDSVLQTGKKLGMQKMDDNILELYIAGRITREDAIEFALDPDGLKRRLF